MIFDVERARQETPGCEHTIHMNNAGAALMPQPVLDAVLDYYQLEACIGGYEAFDQEQAVIEDTYTAIAMLLNAQEEEIALIENATRAWDMAFYSIPFAPGDRILTSVAEYGSNYIAYLQMAKKTGAVIDVIPNDESGQLCVSALENMLDERVKLIAITHIPTNGGLVNPAIEVGRLARQAGVLYLLDACQSAGQLPLDVKSIGCHLLSATGRKYLRGPRGTGFLYVDKDLIPELEPPFLDLQAATWTSRDAFSIRPDARRFENWETNYAARLGLRAAVHYALEWGVDTTWARIQILANELRRRLAALPGVKVRDQGEVQCGIVTFTADGWDSKELRDRLFTGGFHCTHSTVFGTRLDMEARSLQHVVRASLHYYNSEGEINLFCNWLEDVLKIGPTR